MRRIAVAFLGGLIVLTSLVQGQEGLPTDEQPDLDKLKVSVNLETGGHSGTVVLLFFSHDGKQLVSVGREGTIRFWRVADGELVRTLRIHAHLHPEGLTQAAAVSADRRTLVINARVLENKSGQRPLVFINLEEGKVERVLRVGSARGHLVSLALSPDGSKVATGNWDGAYVWDAKSGDKLYEIDRKKGFDPAQSVAFSSDGNRLAVLMMPAVHIVDVVSKKLTSFEEGKHLNSLFWTPDDRRVAIAHRNGVSLLNPATGKVNHTWSSGWTGSLVWGPKVSVCLAAGKSSRGGEVSLLELERGKGAKAKEVRSYLMPKREEAKATAAALSPDGKLVAAACEPDHAIHIWTRQGDLQRTLVGRGAAFYGAGWGKAGRKIGWGRASHTSNGLRFAYPLEEAFDLNKLRLVCREDVAKFNRSVRKQGDFTLTLGDPSNPARTQTADKHGGALHFPVGHAISGTFLSDNRVVAGNPHGTVYVFDIKGGWPLRKLHGHHAAVHSTVPSPDGKFLLTASTDQTLKIWNVAKRGEETLLLTFFVAGDDWIIWTPEGYYAGTPGGERLMGWRVQNPLDQLDSFYPAERFRKVLFRPDIIQLVLEKGNVAEAVKQANAQASIKTVKAVDVEQLVPPKGNLELLEKDGKKVKIKVSGTASKGQPVTALRLRVNGRPFADEKFVKQVGPKDEPEATWTVELPPGKHVLDVVVRGLETADVSNAVTVGVEPDEDQKPTLFCLPIGVNYDWDSKLKDLKLYAAENDAATILDSLKVNCAGKENRFRAVVGELLLGKAATKEAILEGIKKLRQKGARPGDLVVVFFAGHGVAEGRSFYLLTADLKDTDARSIPKTGLSGSDLRDALKELRCEVLLIFDACQSAAALPAFSPVTDELGRVLSDEDAAVWIVTAAMAQEAAGEQKGNGRLTGALAEVLKAGPGTFYDAKLKVMNVHHVYSKAADLVRAQSNGKQNPQLLPPWNTPPLIIRKILK